MKVLDFMPIEYISRESVEAYRNRLSAYKPGHPWVKLNYEEYLEQIGAAAVSQEDGNKSSYRKIMKRGITKFGCSKIIQSRRL